MKEERREEKRKEEKRREEKREVAVWIYSTSTVH